MGVFEEVWGFRGLEAGNTTIAANEEEDEIEYLTIALFFTTLMLSQLILFVSRKFDQSVIPEAGLLLILGMIVGGFIRLSEKRNPAADVVKTVKQLTDFDVNLFFVILLPPIIFDSGFTIRHNLFFGNFGLIVSLAVIGTIISTLFTGVIVYGFSTLDGVYSADLMECMIFGALISATDPVTVIAVFNRIGVKASLLIVVFGESVLNDAVALVMYKTMVLFEVDDEESVSTGSVFGAILSFVKIFLGSLGIGILIGVLSALLFKYLELWESDMRHLEATLALVCPYVSYSLADGFGLSGIVSILFTGITMASYTQKNLSPESSHFLSEIFSVLAHMAETFIFIYVGMAVFTGDSDRSGEAIAFGFVGLFACLIARFFAVIPICLISNCSRRPEVKLSAGEIFVLWFSGLRGGMAYAISAQSVDELDESPNGQVVKTGKVFETATIIIVFATVFFFGGSVRTICERLNLVEDDSTNPLPSPLVSSPTGYTTPKQSTRGRDTHGMQEIELGNLHTQSTASVRHNSSSGEFDNEDVHPSSPGYSSSRGLWHRIDQGFISPVLIRSTSRRSSVTQGQYEEGFDSDEGIDDRVGSVRLEQISSSDVSFTPNGRREDRLALD